MNSTKLYVDKVDFNDEKIILAIRLTLRIVCKKVYCGVHTLYSSAKYLNGHTLSWIWLNSSYVCYIKNISIPIDALDPLNLLLNFGTRINCPL